MTKKLSENIKYSDTPTMFTDGVNIACRLDGGLLLQFISQTPDIWFENFRTVIGKDEVVELIDNLASAIDYYPLKPEEQIKEMKTTKTRSQKK